MSIAYQRVPLSLYGPRPIAQEAKKRAKEKAEAQKQVEALLAAASGQDKDNGAERGDGSVNNGAGVGVGGGGGAGEPEGPTVDPAKRAKALNKKLKKLEGVKAKRDAGEAINAVSACSPAECFKTVITIRAFRSMEEGLVIEGCRGRVEGWNSSEWLSDN